jgi:hypothetical protein
MSTGNGKTRVVKPRSKKERAAEQVPDFLEVSNNLGAYMREEVKPPDMLVQEWLQKGVLHWAQGEPEDGKSWVMLYCAVKLLQEDDEARVLLMDGEMSAHAVAERLRSLGLDPGTAEARVTHVNLSVVPADRFADFVVWAISMRFTLIIWDPIAHHLAGAGMDENSNSEVQRWIACVVNPLLAQGSTVVGVDHVPKSGDNNGYARGASAKKARSRVVYDFDKNADFDRETVGEIIVKLAKNSDAAAIPKERQIFLGGDPTNGRFVLRVSEREPVPKVNSRREGARRIVDEVVRLLESEGRELAGTLIAKRVQGKEATVKDVIRENALSAGGSLHQRAVEMGHQTRLYYSLRTDNGVRLGPS